MHQINTLTESQNISNEDAIHIVDEGNDLWFCLCNGAAGSGGGKAASSSVVTAFKDMITSNRCRTPEDFEGFLRGLDRDLSLIEKCGETTAILGRIQNGAITGASVGDSEAWVYQKAYDFELTQLQRLKPLLGSGQCVPIGFGPLDLEYVLLVGSDGLFKYVSHHDIKNVVEGEQEIQRFSDLAKKETGSLQDDISVISIRKV